MEPVMKRIVAIGLEQSMVTVWVAASGTIYEDRGIAASGAVHGDRWVTSYGTIHGGRVWNTS